VTGTTVTTTPSVRLIDWRTQFTALEPFLSTDGGVVHILAAADAPTFLFSKALRLWMDTTPWPRRWRIGGINPLRPTTHYLEDIVLHLEQTLELAPLNEPVGRLVRIEVARDIRARRGDVVIRDNAIHVNDDVNLGYGLRRRIDRLADSIRSESGSRLAVICVNSHDHSPESLRSLRDQVWDGVLAPCVDSGLLLIDIGDGQRHSEYWPPPPNVVIDLPSRYEGAARADAEHDLAALALAERRYGTEPEAETFAKTLLDVSHNVRNLHANLATCLGRGASFTNTPVK
jgi:hypothetical protein